MLRRTSLRLYAVALLTAAALPGSAAAAGPPSLSPLLPTAPEQCTAERTAQLRVACEATEAWAAEQTVRLARARPQQVLELVEPLLAADAEAEAALDALLPLRTRFANVPRDDPRRDRIRQFLSMCRQLIDLVGRLNYQQRDAVDNATYAVASDLPRLEQLIDRLTEARSEPGAKMLGFVLDEPPPDSGLRPYPPAAVARVLRLMAAARSLDVLPELARFVRREAVAPGLRLSAIEVIRHLGVPQDPHPQQDPTIQPPLITAGELLKIARAAQLPESAPAEAKSRRDELLKWLAARSRRGLAEDRLRVGRIEVQPGDWFLMRNPSPFNMFTDLTPGLFTHVGVATMISDDRGVRRMVVADLPERGDRVPATNVDAYAGTTLHYWFLRHQQPQVNRKIAEAAADTIGNPSQFDLLFRTSRVQELAGGSLREQRIHTYCAGFLLVSTLYTGLPRSEFFPIAEYPPSELCERNLAKLGVRLGEQFISPTGPLFSPRHVVVGGRKPLYSPSVEIQTHGFDYFGRSMAERPLRPSPGLFQSLRAKVAGLSRYNPWLARALASAANVSPRMDLQAAARAAAVVETLDEIVYRARDDFALARRLAAYSDQELAAELAPDSLDRLPELRRRHAALLEQSRRGEVTPRQLRIALVDYYQAQVRRELNERFFPGDAK